MVKKRIVAVETDALAKLGKELNDLHQKVLEGARTSLAAAKEAGDLLIYVRHSWQAEYSAWLAKHATFSDRTARAYIRVAENWGEIKAKWAELDSPKANLSINRALQLIKEQPVEPAKIIQVMPKADASYDDYQKRRAYRDGVLAKKAGVEIIDDLLARHGLKAKRAAVLNVLYDLGIPGRTFDEYIRKVIDRQPEPDEGPARKPRQPRVAQNGMALMVSLRVSPLDGNST